MPKEMAVPSGINPRADWSDPSRYQPLLKLDRSGWAWEWLRRNTDYSAQAKLMMGRVPSGENKQLGSIPAIDEMAGWGLLCRGKSRPPGN